MRLSFLGVRGSTPAPGPDFVRYGGHTSCVAVSLGPAEPPTLLLDAGTGLRALTGLLDGNPFRGSALITHLHWDHVQGLPFTPCVDRHDARVDVFVPAQDGRSGRELLEQSMSPPAFPITPAGLNGRWSFTAVEPGSFTAEDFAVTAFDVAHKGGRTYGFRIEANGASVAYLPDHAPAAGVSDEATAAMRDVDVLIHDAEFLDDERPTSDLYGHGTVADAVALADRVGAAALVLFHHGPNRTDDALDRIRDGLVARSAVVLAAEGDVLDVRAGQASP